MDRTILEALLPDVKRIAREAADAILVIAREPLGVRDKLDGSPVTRADMAAHRIILAGLRRLEPNLPVLSEEDVPSAGDLTAATCFWCVDPLDGTKEFIKGDGDYTVNIALVEEPNPILGVVLAPARGLLWYAARTDGAWRETRDEDAHPVRLPDRTEPGRPLTAVVSRSHSSPETEAFLRQYGVEEVLRHGSSLKICAVAEGAADVYPRLAPTCLWDTAAGAAIAREAGCRVVAPDGNPLKYNPGNGLKHNGFLVLAPDFAYPR